MPKYNVYYELRDSSNILVCSADDIVEADDDETAKDILISEYQGKYTIVPIKVDLIE